MGLVKKVKRIAKGIASNRPDIVKLSDGSELKIKIKPKIKWKDKKLKKLNVELKFSHPISDDVEVYINVKGDIMSIGRVSPKDHVEANVTFTKRF